MILNEVKVVGNLTSDAQVRFTPKGTPVAALSLGVNEPYETESGERRQVTTFVDVRVWGPSGENLARLAKKGTELFVEGALRQDRWEDAETGQTRTRVYVKAQRWQFTQYRPKDQTPRGWDQIEGGKETPKTQPEPEAQAPQAPAPEAPAPSVEPAPVATAKPQPFKRLKKAVA